MSKPGVANCICKERSNPSCATWFTSVGVGPNVACSRNRAAATCETGCADATTFAVTAEDVAAPGSGFRTTMLTVPICKTEAVPEICNSVGETYVVVTVCPPNVTVELLTKPLPVSARPNAPVGIAAGATEFRMGIGFWRVTTLLADFDVSPVIVAVTVMLFDVGRVVGAVYIPLVSIVPTSALPPVIEFTDHVTLWLALALSLIVTSNVSVAPARTVAVPGVKVTSLLAPSAGNGDPSLPCRVPRPEQPLRHNTSSTACASSAARARGAASVKRTARARTTARSTGCALRIFFSDMTLIGPPTTNTSPHARSTGSAAVRFLISTSKRVGRCCLGTPWLKNTCGIDYWPRGQNEVIGL